MTNLFCMGPFKVTFLVWASDGLVTHSWTGEVTEAALRVERPQLRTGSPRKSLSLLSGPPDEAEFPET